MRLTKMMVLVLAHIDIYHIRAQVAVDLLHQTM
jgi:hypothetical protein